MAKVVVWHNPRCRKSRAGVKYLEEKGVEFEIVDYIKNGVDVQELARIIRLSGRPVSEFIRTNEKEYRELGLKGKELTPEEFAQIVAEHPKLLQRPIVVAGDKVVLAQPPERVEEIL
ncbi:MAG: arsenate reductase (glutaredoxin) [Calditrichaeota bacterium]|nr:arsenate reductase (glutaredoxin) [Calditrichota bacterium]